MKFSLFACVGLVAAILLPVPHSATAQSTSVARPDDRVGQIFSDLEKRIIREVLAETGIVTPDEQTKREDEVKGSAKGRKGGLPPGLAKRDRLPPGLQKQLDRNGRLPLGLDRRALPADLENRLPERTDTTRVIVDNDVVLIQKGTDLVLDVIRDVVLPKTGASQ